MAVPIRMPMPGQMTEECTVLQWYKAEGDTVLVDLSRPFGVNLAQMAELERTLKVEAELLLKGGAR